MIEDSTVCGFVLLNPDGIPIRYHQKLSYSTAVLYASLVTDFCLRSKQALIEMLGKCEDSDISNFRLRTAEGTELITSVYNDYLFVVIQNCTGKPWKWGDDPGGTE